jgi:hypothetical protein
MKHRLNTGKQTVILGVGGMVNKPRLHVLIYQGKPLVCLGLSENDKVPPAAEVQQASCSAVVASSRMYIRTHSTPLE